MIAEGYIPSLMNASPIHLLVIIATMSGTMYISPPVSSNMITTRETSKEKWILQDDYNASLEQRKDRSDNQQSLQNSEDKLTCG